MPGVTVVRDEDACRELWGRLMPDELFCDLWDVRGCFHRHFARPLHFVVAESGDGVEGALPLCWVEESGCYACFPGETWEGTTWLEQNRLLLRRREALDLLLEQCPEYHLRYLLPPLPNWDGSGVVDETGYLFHPPMYGYDLERYFSEFRPKTAKRLRREIAAFEKMDLTFRHDTDGAFDEMMRLNVERFGPRSYFHDPRFREGFRDLIDLLDRRGWLRVTTVALRDEVAAVDLGCIYRGTYTLLAGGTDARYPGVAKLINMHHIEYACAARLEAVDFLCGDFNWKAMFHLTPRPLYLLSNLPPGRVGGH